MRRSTRYSSFCDWLSSLGMFSGFIHAVACVRMSFLLNNIPLSGETTFYPVIHPGQLGYFHKDFSLKLCCSHTSVLFFQRLASNEAHAPQILFALQTLIRGLKRGLSGQSFSCCHPMSHLTLECTVLSRKWGCTCGWFSGSLKWEGALIQTEHGGKLKGG